MARRTVHGVSGNAFTERTEREVEEQEVFPKRPSTVPFGDIPVDGIGRGDCLRRHFLPLERPIPHDMTRKTIQFRRILPHPQLLITTVLVPSPHHSPPSHSIIPSFHHSTIPPPPPHRPSLALRASISLRPRASRAFPEEKGHQPPP